MYLRVFIDRLIGAAGHADAIGLRFSHFHILKLEFLYFKIRVIYFI
jgi:hypothetical protein